MNSNLSPTVSLRTVGIDSEFPGFSNIYENSGEAELVGEPEALATGLLTRRHFMGLTAASLAAVAGCRRPDLEILPYSKTPDYIVPGVPLYYATSMPKPGGCFPVLVESNEGRPTKIEGNPKHPASMGACDVHTQASILDLYSPDRSKQVLKKNADGALIPKTWEEFDAFAAEHFSDLRKKQGEGLRFLMEDHPSPAMRLLREHMKTRLPKAVWHVYEPIDNTNSRRGSKIASGFELPISYDFGSALRIVSLDCDFLGAEGNEVVNGRAFAAKRRDARIKNILEAGRHEHDKKHDAAEDMSRLYSLESTYTVTGTMADHRLRIPAAHIVDYAVALAKEIASTNGVKLSADITKALLDAPLPGVVIPDKWIKEVAADLIAYKGKGLVVAGSRQPPLVHALCWLINRALENPGAHRENVYGADDHSIAELAKEMNAGGVKTLIIVGGNPAYNAPADLEFAKSMDRVGTVIRLGQFVDETSEKATWHLPQAHYLESWGDAETEKSEYCGIQPSIAPLHYGRSALELFIQFSLWDNTTNHADAKAKVYKLLQESFKKKVDDDERKTDDLAFKRFIQEGSIKLQVLKPGGSHSDDPIVKAIAAYRPAKAVSSSNLEITFHPSYSLYDGRYAWNGWLLELPDPITKLSWDNAALVSPKTAEHLKVKTGDLLEIDNGSAKIKIPAFILPGQADWSVALSLGWGKLRIGNAADGGGFDVYPLRTSTAMHFTTATVKKTGERYDLVVTQEHGTIPEEKKQDIIREFSWEDYKKHHHGDPGAHGEPGAHGKPGASATGVHEHHHTDDPKSRFQWGYDQSKYKGAGPRMRDIKKIALRTAEDISFPQRLDGYMQWGMVIDLNTCTGCSACVVACQAENNIPIVGKNEVKMNREMHWISLHRYFMHSKPQVTSGLESQPTDDSPIVNQPMMCQHCEAAPCESVCPVNAAVHSPEGLNLQVYNRCIGTRYCSNNCPYKVRRFNFFDFNKRRLDELRVPTPFSEAGTPETLKMQKNPEVTVRMRGVMEKCTYCIQRIEKGKIGAKVLAIKAGADKIDSTPPADPYKAGYDIRVYDGASRIIVPDGIVHTACEQACPTGAIVFGNVRDERSKVHQIKNAEGGPDYLVQGNLNTKPRTSYLPRLRNLNKNMLPEGAHT